MKLLAQGRISGACPSPNITVWGKESKERFEKYRKDIGKCVQPFTPRDDRRYGVRVDFHLNKQALKLSDLDNLAKTVLDGVFGTFGKKGEKPMDRFVYKLELNKLENIAEEFTEIWIFDLGPVE